MKKASIFWFTGLSGSGKTTVAEGARSLLETDGYSVLVLDGDDVRRRLHADLGFSEEDIKKNNNAIAGLCRQHRNEYDVVLVPIISPYASSRKEARETLGAGFYEVYFSADLETVARRDVKGLYSKAGRGEISNLIGFSAGAVYERPERPDLVIDSSREGQGASISSFYKFVIDKLRAGERILDYKKLMDMLLALPTCVLFTTGRTGTDLLQSLLDSHPQVLTFNGHLFYHDFWNASLCVSAEKFELSDFLDEFIGRHIEKFKSRYDLREGKDQLGDDFNSSIDIDLNKFKSEVARLLGGREINSRNSMVALYAAYAICLGQDIQKKTILFHHLHDINRAEDYLKDFPDSKIICMTRDPRANFVSGIEHWRRYLPSTDNGGHLYFYIKRILEDAHAFKKYKNECAVIRIEDLGNERMLRSLCDWLNISYNECMRKSTWGGLAWHGDRVSQNREKGSGFSEAMLNNNWEKRLSAKDKFVLNYIMYYRLRHYGYVNRKIGVLDFVFVPFLIVLPLSYESRFFSFGYIMSSLKNKEYTKIVRNFLFYLKRIALFLKYYLKVIRKERFECLKIGDET